MIDLEKIYRNKILMLGLVLICALGFRLWLADKGWHVDMWSNAGWGEWIYEHGKGRFYDNNIWTYAWPTQLPLVNSIYAFNKMLSVQILGRAAWIEYQVNKIHHIGWLSSFVQWWGYGKVNPEVPFQMGFLITMKLMPILADLGIAYIVYKLSGKKLVWPVIYLVSPFSWFLSSWWGQYDGLGVLLMLTAFASLDTGWGYLGPGFMTLSVLVKPTSLILIPFFGFVYLKKLNKKRLAGLLLPLLIYWVTTQPYTHKNPVEFGIYDLKRIVFEKSESRLSVNSFNIWRVFIGDKGYTADVKIGFLPAWIWGLLIFTILNLAAIRTAEKDLWEGLFITAAGGWMFLTGMLERYFMAGVVCGLIVAARKPKLFKYWLIMSLLFWINLYHKWWYPDRMGILKSILTWRKEVVTQFLSGMNVIAYIILLKELVKFPKLIPGNFRKSPVHPARPRKNGA